MPVSTYKARPIDLLRMWHTKIEAWILEQAEIEQLAVIEAAPAMSADFVSFASSWR